MKTFQCTRLRLCNYLMDRGFFPYRVEPDPSNPRYKIYLFEETPALTAAAVRYFSTDCYTARKRFFERTSSYGNETNAAHYHSTDHPANGTDAV